MKNGSEDPQGKPAVFGRPLDGSLEAYKDCINAAVEALGVKGGNNMTPDEWEAAWKEFWSKEEPPAPGTEESGT